MHEVYCQQHDLSITTFKKYFYRHRGHSKPCKTSGPERFAPVTLSQVIGEEVKPYEILFPGGILLKIPGTKSLADIMKSLRGYV
jgi:hypothetical protein